MNAVISFSIQDSDNSDNDNVVQEIVQSNSGVLLGEDVHNWRFEGDYSTSFQVVSSDFSKNFLIDPFGKKAFVFTENFFTADFWFYQSPTNQAKTFEVESSCPLIIFQLHEQGGFEGTAFDGFESKSLPLLDDDKLFFSLKPFEQRVCSGSISAGLTSLVFSVDFALVESSEDFVRRYSYSCDNNSECFKTLFGEEVNVTVWEAKGCPFENIRQGNEACQAWYLSSLESERGSLEERLSEAEKSSNPEVAKKLDESIVFSQGLLQELIDYQFYFLLFLFVSLVLAVVFVVHRSMSSNAFSRAVSSVPRGDFGENMLKSSNDFSQIPEKTQIVGQKTDAQIVGQENESVEKPGLPEQGIIEKLKSINSGELKVLSDGRKWLLSLLGGVEKEKAVEEIGGLD